ncbi:alpha/beta fold hydrolase [Spirulina sp. CS-785/01]|uniref:YqiA/YcfP family alpha/beta fold hydrolase n=1 Tax=Spirulina sp. CS-785/01 TaxID=3021716 RepID=UPI00232AB591|nr:YqiA/YcfP family alpha/beta fold hydrolase [Spirulina sp. CS-785/01]MDB9315503.1 alpha/beta fold hydrolase [Spirulina sp. CS-785/01]
MSYYLYLHGFASGPKSAKAQYLCDRFTECDIPLYILDLNQGDFSHLTLTRQLQQVKTFLPPTDIPVTLIGSSFGGLTAAFIAQLCPQVKQIIGLAPAFGFLRHWLPKLGPDTLQQWQTSGYHPVYHYAEQREIPLHYQFISDLQQYPEASLNRDIPTLILHGIHDDVIPLQASQTYCQNRPWTTLIELDSDHTLSNVMPQIWQEIKQFLEIGYG